MSNSSEHPGRALLQASLSRDLTREELSQIYAWGISVEADLREKDFRLDQLVGENPTAAMFSEVAVVMRENLKINAVMSHAHVPAVLKHETQVQKTEEAKNKAALQVALNEAAEIEVRRDEAAKPSVWTPQMITAIVGLVTVLTGTLTTILQMVL